MMNIMCTLHAGVGWQLLMISFLNGKITDNNELPCESKNNTTSHQKRELVIVDGNAQILYHYLINVR